MHRIDTAGATPPGYFNDGDFANGVRPTVPDASWANDFQENVARAIERTGNPLVLGDYDQMANFLVGDSAPVYLSNYASLQAALAFIGATKKVLCIDQDITIANGTVIIPTNVTLVMTGVGVIMMGANAFLQILGPAILNKGLHFDWTWVNNMSRVTFGPRSLPGGIAYAEWFGARPGTFSSQVGGDRDTFSIQLALLSLAADGGTVRLSHGWYTLDPAYALTATSILEIPDKVNLVGSGMYSTVLQKKASVRAWDINLITNARIGSATGFNGGGYFTLADFTVDAGDLTPTSNRGDLVGLGHGMRINVERIRFASHDQAGLRIHGCQEVAVRGCVFDNQVALAVASPVRIEKSFAVGNNSDFLGCNIDGTDPQEITVEGNTFFNTRSDTAIEIRSGNPLYRSRIQDNTFTLTTQLNGAACAIYASPLANVWMLEICRNIIRLDRGANHVNGIVLDSPAGGGQREILIADNMIQGNNVRYGIRVGGSATPSAAFVGAKRVTITGNTLELSATVWEAIDYSSILVYGCTGIVSGNSIKPAIQNGAVAGPAGQTGITVDSCEDIAVENNRIEHDGAVTQPYQNYYGIKIKIDHSGAQNLLSRVNVRGNRVQGNYRVFIGFDDTYLLTVFGVNALVAFSDNRTRGTAYRAHYLDMCGACDGTNDRQLYDFSPYGGTRAYYGVSSNNSYPISVYVLGLGFAMHRKVTYLGLVDGLQPRMYNRRMFAATITGVGGQTLWHDMADTTDGAAKLWGTFVYQVRCTDNGSGNVPATCEFWLNTGKDGIGFYPNSFANHGATYQNSGFIMLEVGI